MHMFEAVMVFTVTVTCFLFIGWLVWLISRHRRERLQQNVDLRTRMLDKFGTSEEFVAFMHTDAGKNFLEASTRIEKQGKSRVASSLSWAAILIMVGLAFFAIVLVEGDRGPMIPALLFLAIGTGLAISAYIYSRFGRENGSDG